MFPCSLQEKVDKMWTVLPWLVQVLAVAVGWLIIGSFVTTAAVSIMSDSSDISRYEEATVDGDDAADFIFVSSAWPLTALMLVFTLIYILIGAAAKRLR